MAEFVFDDEVPVPQDALNCFRAKALRLSWGHREVYREEHDLAFTVAKVACIDLLSDIRKHVEQALEEGRTLQQFQRELQPVLEGPNRDDPDKPIQPGNPRRLKTSFDANMPTARAAGQWKRAQRTKRAGPFFIYELGPSAKHRPEHQDWEGTAVPVDAPWLNAHYPPNGWGCKCRLRQISRAEAERQGMKAPPPPSCVDWQNERTGETVRVPRGIEPGWDGNPGKTRHVLGSGAPNAPALRRRLRVGPHIHLLRQSL